ncbi:MAG: pyruvate kinase [Alphaproteobacteria bacterium]|nr:pyruvate kinase [Alphaproteobacteria bacterium]MDD9920325.1 pyruvate kinase [Alphaproteobacteria bacterium]
MRHAKILATLGPSSWHEDGIRTLIRAGVNGFRLNFSHGEHARHLQTAQLVRQVAKEESIAIALLQDLQGPKIRVGDMLEPVSLNKGDTLVLDDDPTPGTAERVCLPHPDILAMLQVGDVLFVNDGLLRLEVTACSSTQATCTVLNNAVLSSRKGINIPGRDLPCTALMDKDKKDLQFGLLDIEPDWIALSFVQRATDIAEARDLIKQYRPDAHVKLMAKIETAAAIDNIESIIEATDGIMIARGDLGVELPPEEIPPIQKKIIRLCRKAGKPVVVATQMLESMIQNPTPTRAEVTDIANATYEGADCLMLSAESAAGKYPAEAVEVMAKTIARVEKSSAWGPLVDARMPSPQPEVRDAITAAACHTAETIQAAAIVTFTETGGTALRVSRWRPSHPVYCLTPYPHIAQQLGIVWGVKACYSPHATSEDHMVQLTQETAQKNGLTADDGQLVVTAGVPFGQSGTTNILRVVDVG